MPSDIFDWDSRNRHSRNGSLQGTRRNFTVMPRSPQEALEPDHAPEPPPGRRGRQQHPVFAFLNAIVTLIFIILIGAGVMFYFVRTEFDRQGPLDHDTVVIVPKGEGLSAIAERLERDGVISNRYVFQASVRLYFHAESKLKAGEYPMKKYASIRGVLDTLISGRASLSSVSFPEGFTSQQIIDRLIQNSELTGEVSELPPEGSLLPDTYRFARGVSRDDMIKRMQAEQHRFLDKVWEERSKDTIIKSKEELVTLASIVEKETGKADERPRVAAVFLNRLKKGMRLQSDPTFMYGITMGKAPLGHSPTRTDRDTPTPYNTYTIPALPPGPIANAGRAAIEAVLHPAKTSNLYFVADGTGGHVFADTNAEHNANVEKWREIERKMRAERAASGQDAGEQDASGADGAGSDSDGQNTAGNQAAGAQAANATEAVAPVASSGKSGATPPLPSRKPKKL
jgi:UPF0755 protein